MQLKTLNKWGYKLFSVYEEPLDMRLMVNDYLETARENYDVPSIPGMLVHLNLNKKQFSELMQLEDQYTQVLSMGMLKIESLLISMWLQKKLESKTLGLVLKNYHWLVDKVEEVRTHKHEHSVSVIVKPSIEDKVDGRIIDVEWSESETETEWSEVDEDGDD